MLKKNKNKVRPRKNSSLILFPVISSNPSTAFAFGAASKYTFYSKGGTSERLSAMSANILYTTKGQTLLFVKNNIYALKNKLFLSGDWRLYFFSENTYGLGTNAPEGAIVNNIFGLNGWETSNDSLTQPLRFNYIKFHQTGSYEVSHNLFAGIGIHLDRYYEIRDERLDTANNYFTSHFGYSKANGFNPVKYTTAGISANLVFDSRDNIVNAYKGYFFNANFRYNQTWLGSTKSSTVTLLEYRSFHSLSQTNPRHVLAFWGIGNFVTGGNVPYLSLPAIGYDQRGRSGRGYAAGRFRGESLIYLESEYRFPISPCGGILGGVLFVNGTTTTNKASDVKLFNYIRAGYGAGIRIMVDKSTRTNLGIDFGIGAHTTGIYLNASETF